MIGARCKVCRRLGIKLFLKGERCYGQKCEIVKRNYPPGLRLKKRRMKISEYGKELAEKQKLRKWYNVSEKQFKKYVTNILKMKEKKEDAGDLLIKRLESRLDNVIFRFGFAQSRFEAKQMVSHGHFLVNKKNVNIPSFEVKKGDEIEVREKSKKNKKLKDLKTVLKNNSQSLWLSLNADEMKGKVLYIPSEEEANVPVETSVIFEFYSK